MVQFIYQLADSALSSVQSTAKQQNDGVLPERFQGGSHPTHPLDNCCNVVVSHQIQCAKTIAYCE